MAVNWTNVTDVQGIINAPNETTGGYFWLVVLFLVWVVLLIGLSWAGIEVALLVAGFIAIVISLMMVYMNVIAFEWSLFFIGLEIFLILYVVWSSSKDNY